MNYAFRRLRQQRGLNQRDGPYIVVVGIVVGAMLGVMFGAIIGAISDHRRHTS